MSKTEQDQQLKDLLFKQHELGRELACLASRIKNIAGKLESIVHMIENPLPYHHWPEAHKQFRNEGGRDLDRYVEEYKKTKCELEETGSQIRAIESPIT